MHTACTLYNAGRVHAMVFSKQRTSVKRKSLQLKFLAAFEHHMGKCSLESNFSIASVPKPLGHIRHAVSYGHPCSTIAHRSRRKKKTKKHWKSAGGEEKVRKPTSVYHTFPCCAYRCHWVSNGNNRSSIVRRKKGKCRQREVEASVMRQ